MAALDPDPVDLVEPGRLQALHGRMLEAVLHGGGLRGIAQLAADVAGAPVVVDLRAEGRASSEAGVLERPALRVPIAVNGSAIGTVSLHADGPPAPAADDALHAAAMATLTFLALRRGVHPRDDAGAALVDAALDGAPHALSRLRDVGLDPSEALVARVPAHGTGRVLAALADRAPGALRSIRGGWVHALLPAGTGANRVAAQLQDDLGLPAAGAPAADDPAVGLGHARLTAQLVADGAAPLQELETGVWRLLVRGALRDASEIAALADDALGALWEDEQASGDDLLRTFAAYLACDGNMSATAAALPAHRHTIAYRLERLRAMTGLDPFRTEGRERLGVALKARAVVAALTRVTPPAPR